MDAKHELGRIWKDVQDSAKEFAHYSLTMSSKALDVAADRLKGLTAELKARAEKLAPEGEAEAPKVEEPTKPAA